ncbi:MAG: hypothetical protein NC081_12445 [Roseburia sp.]|nr:hypothetical protein [Roseburia sp.]
MGRMGSVILMGMSTLTPYARSSSNLTKISYRNSDGSVAGTITLTKSGKKKPKKIQYSFKEVSARILNAKTSGNARSAVIMARNRTAMLRRQLRSGEYDSRELAYAIIHAEQMERVARKKQKHLQQEERAERTDTEDPKMDKWEEGLEEQLEEDAALGLEETQEFSKEELQQLLKELQELMEETLESQDISELLGEAGGLEELSEELLDSWEEMEPEDLELRKRKHRADELRDIVEADMKYLKALFDLWEKEQQSGISGNVSLQLGGAEVPVAAPEEPVLTEGGEIDISV